MVCGMCNNRERDGVTHILVVPLSKASLVCQQVEVRVESLKVAWKWKSRGVGTGHKEGTDQQRWSWYGRECTPWRRGTSARRHTASLSPARSPGTQRTCDNLNIYREQYTWAAEHTWITLDTSMLDQWWRCGSSCSASQSSWNDCCNHWKDRPMPCVSYLPCLLK